VDSGVQLNAQWLAEHVENLLLIELLLCSLGYILHIAADFELGVIRQLVFLHELIQFHLNLSIASSL
jgi:hypothetical protein